MNKARIGPIYRLADYPGFFKRVAVDLLDFGVVGLAMVAALFILEGFEAGERLFGLTLLAVLLAGLFYLGPFKATGLPTLGYLAFGLKLVDMEGRKVGYLQSIGRLAFMAVGPINYLVDLLWMYHGTMRQTLRDKVSGTYVVRRNAVKVGEGPIVFKVIHGMGYRFISEEIVPHGGAGEKQGV